MKQRNFGNAKFTALAQDGFDEDYLSDTYSGNLVYKSAQSRTERNMSHNFGQVDSIR